MQCSIMSGKGLDMSFGGSWTMSWLGAVILFFVVLFVRKWIAEEMGVPFNTILAFVFCYFGFWIVLSIWCSYKFALLAGLIGMFVGGFVLGQMTG